VTTDTATVRWKYMHNNALLISRSYFNSTIEFKITPIERVKIVELKLLHFGAHSTIYSIGSQFNSTGGVN
jgi:hypothetical protein